MEIHSLSLEKQTDSPHESSRNGVVEYGGLPRILLVIPVEGRVKTRIEPTIKEIENASKKHEIPESRNAKNAQIAINSTPEAGEPRGF